MFRRKRDPERAYKHENLGNLIIERVQLPHTFHELDGTVHELMTYSVSLRVENGRILFERNYVKGRTPEFEATNPGWWNDYEPVESGYETTWNFYDALSKAFDRIGFY